MNGNLRDAIDRELASFAEDTRGAAARKRLRATMSSLTTANRAYLTVTFNPKRRGIADLLLDQIRAAAIYDICPV